MIRETSDFDRRMLRNVHAYLAAMKSHSRPIESAALEWTRFYHLCDRLLRRYLLTYHLSVYDLDDCAQDIWLKLMSRLSSFDYDPKRGRFETWVYLIVHDVVIDRFRRRDRQKALLKSRPLDDLVDISDDHASDNSRVSARTEIHQLISKLRSQLSDEANTLVQMRWVKNYSPKKTARLLGISRRQVWYREHRIKQRLRRMLKSDHPSVNAP